MDTNHNLLDTLGKRYGIPNAAVLNVVQETDYNTTFAVGAEKRRYIVRVGKIFSTEATREEIGAIKSLKSKGLAVANVIPTIDGDTAVYDADHSIVIFEYVDGRSIQTTIESLPSLECARAAAQELARIHQATAGEQALIRKHRNTTSEFDAFLDNEALIRSTFTNADEILTHVKNARDIITHADSTQSLVHGDFRSKNVIFSPKADAVTAVVDFEWYSYGPSYYDLGLMLVEWSCADGNQSFDADIQAVILDGYTSVSGTPLALNQCTPWMYAAAMSDAATYWLRTARSSTSATPQLAKSYMYTKALAAQKL